jgi:hypothetical protein
MDLPTRLIPSDDAMVRTIGDETVILDLASGKYFGLDPVGTRLWQLIGEGLAIDDACARLLAEYEVDEPRLRADVAQLLQQLLSHGLLKPA